MMTDDQKAFETNGVPTVYCNQANFSLSFNDVRIYVSELSAGEIVINPSGDSVTQRPARIDPKFCLVMSPEFARSFGNAITKAVEQYESIFGPLRAEISKEQLQKATEKK
jgi:hypothetical protein